MTKYVLEKTEDDYYATITYCTFECELSKDEVLDAIKAQAVKLKKFEDEHYPEPPDRLDYRKDGGVDNARWEIALGVHQTKVLYYQRHHPTHAEAHLGDYRLRVSSGNDRYELDLFTLDEWFVAQSLARVK